MKANEMNKIECKSFTLNPVAATVALVIAAQWPGNLALANGSYGLNTDAAGNVISVPTFYASSPQGTQPAFDPALNAKSKSLTVDTGLPLRKFVDKLAGVYNGLEGNGIPVAITEKWVTPGGTVTSDDYYELAIVEYTQNMHSDLVDYGPDGKVLIDPATGKPKLHGTRLRGYVQIETDNIRNNKLTDITGVVGSESIPAKYPDGTPILDKNGKQVYFVHAPHYLGPVIAAAKGNPVRLKFTNYLPYTDKDGKSVGSWNGQGGEMVLPVDETIAGGGPVLDAFGAQIYAKDAAGKPVLDKNGSPIPIKMGQNRAAIHWHGGDSPWISDGTPHQWFAPAGDIAYTLGKDAQHPNGMGKGVAAVNVPDMLDPGDGSYTLYFPNNLSGRLMMYHDHTSGLTKTNVYMGEAAGYVVYDMTELGLVSRAMGFPLSLPDGKTLGSAIPLLDAVGIPVVIQDKTFVPRNIGPSAVASDGKTPQSQDAKWNLTHWGQPGDLWFPHVYETNQDPNSADGTNPVGRWDWGPWFWPVFPAQMSLPSGEYGHATATPESFMDTPIVNGQAYPTMTVDPKAYRFRILSVANDRSQNLGLYQAVDKNGSVCDGKTTPVANVPANGGTLAPATCTEVKMVPALPTPGFPKDWPTDGRVGGVPDPATAGPDIVQIGSEGGLLPAPAIWKSQPVNYETNVRSITMLNILQHGLLLMGGERADVLIDFSEYAGQTLILYNDAPAPMPGYDPRIDYYTGVGDQTDAGGAYDTPPGYGPNTRTVMQIKVNATNTSGAGGPLNMVALTNGKDGLPAAYAATQPAPLIPQVAYNAPYSASYVNNFASIGTGSGLKPDFTYTVPPYKVMEGGVEVTKTTKTLPVINKAIQELFDPIYGRMNATLAVELPYSTATVATTIPLAYIDVPVERLDAIKEGETQIWKVTHNGVDSHPVHFHMVNVQVINRVGWDGTIKPPEPNEVGWKETLRMNPLEDVYVAVKAVRPVTPFGVPRSSRVLDPSQTEGSTLGFTQIDPTTGEAPLEQWKIVNGSKTNVQVKNPNGGPVTYSNALTDFDNEYVWHCHILGHEEQDFMRPFIFHPNVVVPDMPTNVTVSGTDLTWTDPTPFGGADSQDIPTAGKNAKYPEPTSNAKNEIGFKVLESKDGGTTYTQVATAPANVTKWTGANSAYKYQVLAYNDAGDSSTGVTVVQAGQSAAVAAAVTSTAAPTVAGPAGPGGLTQTVDSSGNVVLTWAAVPGATGYVVTVNGVAKPPVTGTTYTVLKAELKAGIVNTFSVFAQTPSGNTSAVTTSLYDGAAQRPVGFTASKGNQGKGLPPGSITVDWANNPVNVNNVANFKLTWTLTGSTTPTGTATFAPTVTGATIINLSRDKDYTFTLQANSNFGNSPTVSVVGLSAP